MKPTKTRTKKSRHNKTAKSPSHRPINNKRKSHFVRIFLETLNTVKLYHWKTRSYARHKATDELYGKLNENIDKFIEVLLGKDESRIKMVDKQVRLMDFDSEPTDFKKRIYKFRDTLIEMDMYLNKKSDSDLLSIRDDILVDVNQFLYLMTFE
jgi:hypothetical protein